MKKAVDFVTIRRKAAILVCLKLFGRYVDIMAEIVSKLLRLVMTGVHQSANHVENLLGPAPYGRIAPEMSLGWRTWYASIMARLRSAWRRLACTK